ncbi:MAG: hypothetical protein KDC71_24710, partial [Acidobacteria bacterium]|nr:hypothetical protein [Acidobacteriota bacterium]
KATPQIGSPNGRLKAGCDQQGEIIRGIAQTMTGQTAMGVYSDWFDCLNRANKAVRSVARWALTNSGGRFPTPAVVGVGSWIIRPLASW